MTNIINPLIRFQLLFVFSDDWTESTTEFLWNGCMQIVQENYILLVCQLYDGVIVRNLVIVDGQIWICVGFLMFPLLSLPHTAVSDEEPLRSRRDEENPVTLCEGEWSFLLLHMTWEGKTGNCREEKLEIQRSVFQSECFNRSCPPSPPPSFLLLPFRDPFSFFVLTTSPPHLKKYVDE